MIGISYLVSWLVYFIFFFFDTAWLSFVSCVS